MTAPPTASHRPVVRALGHVTMVNRRVVTIAVEQRVDAEEKAAVEEMANLLRQNEAAIREADPHADAVIMKAVQSAMAGPLTATRTESFVFTRDADGSWHYTTALDAQFARAGL